MTWRITASLSMTDFGCSESSIRSHLRHQFDECSLLAGNVPKDVDQSVTTKAGDLLIEQAVAFCRAVIAVMPGRGALFIQGIQLSAEGDFDMIKGLGLLTLAAGDPLGIPPIVLIEEPMSAPRTVAGKVGARTCKGCGKPRGCDTCIAASVFPTLVGYWHYRCFVRARAKLAKETA